MLCEHIFNGARLQPARVRVALVEEDALPLRDRPSVDVADERRVRVRAALRHMLAPILQGGLSTILAVIMLAFSPFDFVIKVSRGAVCVCVLPHTAYY